MGYAAPTTPPLLPAAPTLRPLLNTARRSRVCVRLLKRHRPQHRLTRLQRVPAGCSCLPPPSTDRARRRRCGPLCCDMPRTRSPLS